MYVVICLFVYDKGSPVDFLAVVWSYYFARRSSGKVL